ncbi:MAG: putative toxin-antitoxin system toxin component, PIN family [Bacteroidia bacterium]|nr:putative toxin-antitoxin system toxin component, PIN family [Bacteroidia bacterium]
MKKSKLFVFDTNVVISAMLFAGSKPRAALEHGFNRGTLLISAETLSELRETALSEKFEKYAPLSKRKLFLKRFEEKIFVIDISENVKLCRDPDDDKFLSLAKAGNASAIITGDKDLLILNPFDNIPIITPVAFLKMF